MKKLSTKELVFMAICCDLGLFSKRIIAPFTNIITDSLHIPGGVATSFSLMFIVLSSMLIDHTGVATLMCIVQAVIALVLGMTGSMGALMPLGYIIPGLVIELMLMILHLFHLSSIEKFTIINAISSMFASLTANFIVFHLSGYVLIFYLSVSLCSGFLCGILGNYLLIRLKKVIHF